MEKNERILNGKNNHENTSKNGKKNDTNKDSKIKNKLKKILTTQGVTDIISVNRWWEKEDVNDESEKKWETLEHNGVLFPPKYQPTGIKILYKGEPIALNSYQEEISSYWAGILDNDISTKDMCKKNFFHEFRAAMGKEYEHSKFDDFDFTPLKEYINKQKEINKNKSPEEKKVTKSII
jgi:DNA topoisomerase-1